MWIKRIFAAFVAACALTGTSLIATPEPASAATGGCYGAACNNLDPAGRCDGDAVTVGAINVGDGMLQLRYSPSCASNWGRFAPYERTMKTYAGSGIVVHARVTAWNPGRPSYGTAHTALTLSGTSWSKMTDGRGKACTGVEIIHDHNDWLQSQGWHWGPCY